MKLRISDRMSKPDFQGEFTSAILKAAASPDVISFAGGLPNPDSFPVKEMEAAVTKVLERDGVRALQYSNTEGYMPLRKFISDRYKKQGVDFAPENIIITNGSQQALDMVAATLINPGDAVAVEKPSYLAALQTFHLYGPKIVSVSLNEDGIDCDELEKVLAEYDPKFIYVIPNFQNPTGLTYSAQNRKAVYNVIRNKNVILIEDDPYGELRFDGKTLPYIAAGRFDNCILLGSFSKTATPGMRVGYLVCKNAELLETIAAAKESSDVHTSVLSQYVLYDYLTHNDYDGHIAEIRALYESQCKTMLDAMSECFPASVSYTRPDGGMFIWCTLPEGKTALDFFYEAVECKVAVAPGDPFYTAPRAVRTFRLNYTNASKEEIREGIRRLGTLL